MIQIEKSCVAMYGQRSRDQETFKKPMSLISATESLLADFCARPTLRAGSLIITVFGDAIAPRGGTVWIGSLIRVLADFGVNERLVRTSVFRLTRDDWLVADQVGRRSYYSLSANGAERFAQATDRIYGDPRQSWSGDWCLVLLADLDVAQKESMRKELGWLGFGAISTNVLAHPTPDMEDMEAILKRSGLDHQLVVMQGRPLGKKQDDAMRALVHKSWNLDEIDHRYSSFVARFQDVLRTLKKNSKLNPRTAFQMRTLLIQEYRRILLRDPLLPAEMLPPAWNGTAAYELCRDLYSLVYEKADQFMSTEFQTADGALPPPGPEFYQRFNGLPGH
jgi:phenylacetic acid degradation operon negative regulatory protein